MGVADQTSGTRQSLLDLEHVADLQPPALEGAGLGLHHRVAPGAPARRSATAAWSRSAARTARASR